MEITVVMGEITAKDSLKQSRGALFEEPKKRQITAFDFDKLRAAYIAKYGYTVTVPQWDDIIHWKLPAVMTPAEIKERKRRQFAQILGSPSTNWMRAYGTIMTKLDDIEDAATTVMVAGMLLVKYLPRLLGRFVPILGWVLLGKDLLDLLVAYGRTPFSPMGAKRAHCGLFKDNPFGKKAQKRRAVNIRKFKPSFGNLLEVLQTSDIVSGIGLSLGSIVGVVTDSIAGLYRAATGQRVSVALTPPPITKHEYEAARAINAAALINAGGQEFLEEDHHLAHYIGGLASTMLSPWVEVANPLDAVENPLEILVPAPTPWRKETIEVIEEAGYSVEDGVRWPANGKKIISVDELTDWQMPSLAKGFINYAERNKYSHQGHICATTWHKGAIDIIDSLDPSEDVQEEFDPVMELMTRFLRIPVLMEEAPPLDVWSQFSDWVSAWQEYYGKLPSTKIATEKGKDFGIKWKFSYPDKPTPDSEKFFPGISGSWEANEGE